MNAPELNFPALDDDAPRKVAEATIKEVMKSMEATIQEYEQWLSAKAVQHRVSVYIGDYGYGKSVAIDPDFAHAMGVEVGDWVSSSSTC